MRKFFLASIYLVLPAFSSGVSALEGSNHRDNLLNNPESVVYDAPRDRYLVSNWGDGNIVAIDSAGVQSYFNTQMDQAAGLHIVGDVLYAASTEGSLTGIIGFDLETGINVSVADIAEKELLNDVTSDGSEYLYVTDCDADAIYRVRLSDMDYTVLVDEGLGYPNGIIYDQALNRLLVLNGGLTGRPLLAIDLATTEISEVVETGLNAIDGLSVDADGLTYFSSWATDKVYRYDTAFTNPPEVVSEGHSNPADIFVNTVDGILAVPNFDGNTVDFLELQPQSAEGSSAPDLSGLQAFPNPFNSFVSIDTSSLQGILMSHLVIRSLDGRVVRELDCSGVSGSVTWSGDDSRGIPLPSGIYAVSAEIDGSLSSILVLKVN